MFTKQKEMFVKQSVFSLLKNLAIPVVTTEVEHAAKSMSPCMYGNTFICMQTDIYLFIHI